MKILVIGAGPSIDDNLREYKRLGKFPGMILCTDGALNKVLEAGIIPDYCGTLEDTADLDKYYITDIVKKEGHKLKGCYISDRVHNNCRRAVMDAGMELYVAADLRGYITSNVGLFLWMVAHIILKSNDIYLIGMDHCYGKGDGPPVDRNSELFHYGFQVLVNPFDKEEIILHPAFELWKEEFNWYTEKYQGVNTYNCTGRGALYRDSFKWQPITQMQTW